MPETLPQTEGRIPFKGFETWYRMTATRGAGKLPLLTLHGGPGACTTTWSRSTRSPRRAARDPYDQLGCGRRRPAGRPRRSGRSSCS